MKMKKVFRVLLFVLFFFIAPVVVTGVIGLAVVWAVDSGAVQIPTLIHIVANLVIGLAVFVAARADRRRWQVLVASFVLAVVCLACYLVFRFHAESHRIAPVPTDSPEPNIPAANSSPTDVPNTNSPVVNSKKSKSSNSKKSRKGGKK